MRLSVPGELQFMPWLVRQNSDALIELRPWRYRTDL